MKTTTLVIEGKYKVIKAKPKTHTAFNLDDFDKELLIKCIESRQADIDKLIKNYPSLKEVDEIHHESFDLQGLKAMVKESVQLKSVIPNEVINAGWTFRGHNVDMPHRYCEGIADGVAEEISL